MRLPRFSETSRFIHMARSDILRTSYLCMYIYRTSRSREFIVCRKIIMLKYKQAVPEEIFIRLLDYIIKMLIKYNLLFIKFKYTVQFLSTCQVNNRWYVARRKSSPSQRLSESLGSVICTLSKPNPRGNLIKVSINQHYCKLRVMFC